MVAPVSTHAMKDVKGGQAHHGSTCLISGLVFEPPMKEHSHALSSLYDTVVHLSVDHIMRSTRGFQGEGKRNLKRALIVLLSPSYIVSVSMTAAAGTIC